MKFSEVYGVEGTYSHLKCTRVKTQEGIYLIGAEKHREKILQFLGMETCKGAPTPITQAKSPDDELDIPLSPECQKMFRQCVGIGGFRSSVEA